MKKNIQITLIAPSPFPGNKRRKKDNLYYLLWFCMHMFIKRKTCGTHNDLVQYYKRMLWQLCQQTTLSLPPIFHPLSQSKFCAAVNFLQIWTKTPPKKPSTRQQLTEVQMPRKKNLSLFHSIHKRRWQLSCDEYSKCTGGWLGDKNTYACTCTLH